MRKDLPVVLFLEHLRSTRGNAPRTHNPRLTAIKSFMHFVEHRLPSALEQISRVLAIPNQKTDRPLVEHLTAEQCKAILDHPERCYGKTPIGKPFSIVHL
ncbi:MAG: hypothetical protein ACRDFW_07990 [bacterium]